MVATSIRQPGAAPGVARPGVVYGFPVRHGVTGAVVLGYVGKSRQESWEREAQHRTGKEEQPWSDLIVGGAFIIARGVWTDAELAAAEERAIRSGVMFDGAVRRPVHNDRYNRDNPDRVPLADAVAQRREREPGWTPTVGRPQQAAGRRSGFALPTVGVLRVLVRSLRRVPAWAVVWLVLAVGVAAWTILGVGLPAQDGVIVGGGGASGIVAGGMYVRKPRRRRRRR
jgi:hypothetical protein